MEADYADREVVRVHRPFHLIDAESYERRYRTAGGEPLPAGYYSVTWPLAVRVRRFDEQARFAGPFATRAAAEAAGGPASTSMLWRQGMPERRRGFVAGAAKGVTDRRRAVVGP